MGRNGFRQQHIQCAVLLHLAGEHFLCQVGCEMRDVLSAALAAHEVTMASAHEVETDNDLVSLIEANAGIAFVPANGPSSMKLRRLAVPGVDVRRTVSVYAVAGRQRSHVTTTLLNLLRANDWPAEQVLTAG